MQCGVFNLRMNTSILNSREKKKIYQMIKEQWGCDFKTDSVMLRSSKDKIYLVNRDIERVDLELLRVDYMGNYFGTVNDKEIRLSIEGCQIIGPLAQKNVIEVNYDVMRKWLKGEELSYEEVETKPEDKSYILIKYNDNYIGCGKAKENIIKSGIPKNRRILAAD